MVPKNIQKYISDQLNLNNLKVSNQLNAVVFQEYKELKKQMEERNRGLKYSKINFYLNLENFIFNYSVSGKIN